MRENKEEFGIKFRYKPIEESPFSKAFRLCTEKDGIGFISVSHCEYILAHGDLAGFDMSPKAFTYDKTFEGELYDLIDNKQLMRKLKLWSPTGPQLVCGPCSVGWERGLSKEEALKVFGAYIIAMEASSPFYVSGNGEKIERYFQTNPTVVLWEKSNK